MRVLIAGGGTGGHLYPGIAVARELLRRDPRADVTFVGTTAGIESRVLPREGFTLDVIRSGGLKGKSIADRAATPDGSLVAEGFTLFDGQLGVRYRMIELGLDVENIGDASWREVSFATTSRLPWEPAPVTGISYSPGWPRTAIGHCSVFW